VRRIAVIGGGLAGLTVAFRRQKAGDRVVLFEGGPRLGGQLFTERVDGFTVEHGAEGFVAGSDAVRSLATDLGIDQDLVGQRVSRSYSFDGERLAELRPGEAGERLGFQVERRELGGGIGSFRGGMGELSESLARAVEKAADVRLGVAVACIAASGTAWRIELAGGASEQVDAVVVATNAARASAVLEPAFGPSARELALAVTMSSLTVSLAYARASVDHPLDGTGFVVAEAAQGDGFRACTFSSSKLPERAPPDRALLRIFFRPSAADFEQPDAALGARAERALGRAVPLRSGFERAWVSRWPDALPVFDDAHRDRVRELESALSSRAVFLAGAAFHGSGIDVAVRSAEAAAKALG
jgi:oxygen-dependent protoporphyrinogen oxidase